MYLGKGAYGVAFLVVVRGLGYLEVACQMVEEAVGLVGLIRISFVAV